MSASPFDALAGEYDSSFTHTAVGAALRAVVWRRMHEAFAGRARILELGCGTGEDAVELARRGHRVTAIDASAEMVRVARLKALAAGVAARIEFHAMPAEALHTLPATQRFDAVFSNFGVVNCVPEVSRLSCMLASRLAMGAPLLFVVMGRYVPWEWLWYLSRGDPRRAFRRLSRDGVEWRGIRIRYPTPAQLGDGLAAHFRVTRRSALGFALPPSYASAWLDRAPRTLAVLEKIERVASPITASLADHYILEATARVRTH